MTDGLLILIGEAPGPKNHGALQPLFPRQGTAGGRLHAMSGLSVGDYVHGTARMNLVQRCPEKGYPSEEAKQRADIIKSLLDPDDVVICCGMRVAKMMGLEKKFFEQQELAVTPAYVIPHPSGLNRVYNDVANVERVRKIFDCHGMLATQTSLHGNRRMRDFQTDEQRALMESLKYLD